MEIIVLAENETTGAPGLTGEHGLALLVKAGGRRVLFDTGATGTVLQNAKVLGVADDLGRLDAVVLSHGHYDHSGGLLSVLEHLHRPVPVHVGHGFFAPRLSLGADPPRAIGVPFDKRFLEARGARFIEDRAPKEILPGFWLTGEIPLREESQTRDPDLMLGACHTHAACDPFRDEEAMAVEGEGGLTILVGCSHRGVVNSIVAAQTAVGDRPVRMVMGGAHLRAADEATVDWSTGRMRSLTAAAALGHCTGEQAEASFARAFGDRFVRLRTGWRWTDGAIT